MAKKGCAIAIGSVVVLVGIGAGIVFMVWGDLISGARELPARESEARSLGLLIDLSDIGKSLKATPEENAFQDVSAVAAVTHKDEAIVSKDTDLAMKAWSLHPGLFDKALAALERPKYDAGRDWSKGMFVMYPDYAKLKSLARALAAQVRDASLHDDLPRASKSLRGIVQIQRLVSQEPTAISQLVGLDVLAIAQGSAWDAISDHPGNSSWSQLAHELDRAETSPDVPEIVRVEITFAFRAIQSVDPFGKDWGQVLLSGVAEDETKDMLPPIGPGSRDASLARILEHAIPLYQQAVAAKNNDELLAAAMKYGERVELDTRASAMASKLCAGNFAPWIRVIVRNSDLTELLQTAAVLLGQWKAGQGFPKTLPSGSNPKWVYDPTPTGFRLYMLGMDGTDQGGPDQVGFHKAKNSDDFGIVFKN